MIVGVLGGSFDPPHEGHLYVAIKLRKLLNLDGVWWIVSESNFLKSQARYGLEERGILVKNLIANHRRMRVVNVSNSRSYVAMQKLKSRYPHIKFIWICGSDNLNNMHKWHRWLDFCHLLPIVFFERNEIYKSLRMPFAAAASAIRIPCPILLTRGSRGWSMLRDRTLNVSSTEIKKICSKGV